MAELVDAHVSGACSERSAGSSPVPGTKENLSSDEFFFLRVPKGVQVVGRADAKAQVPFAPLGSQAFGTGHQREIG